MICCRKGRLEMQPMARSNAAGKKGNKKAAGKKSNDKKSVKEKFTEMLELPKDLVLDRPKLTLVGNRDMLIENYKSVLEYDTGVLRINTGTGMIRITGSGLSIKEITSDDMVVSGSVRSVEFIDAG